MAEGDEGVDGEAEVVEDTTTVEVMMPLAISRHQGAAG